MNFATTKDLEDLWRPLRPDERLRAEKLIEAVSANLAVEANRVGKDIEKLKEDEAYSLVLKSVVVDIVARTLMTSTDREPMSQESQSALGYTWSGTYLIPGGGIFIKDSELKRLGLKKQRYGVIDFYGQD